MDLHVKLHYHVSGPCNSIKKKFFTHIKKNDWLSFKFKRTLGWMCFNIATSKFLMMSILFFYSKEFCGGSHTLGVLWTEKFSLHIISILNIFILFSLRICPLLNRLIQFEINSNIKWLRPIGINSNIKWLRPWFWFNRICEKSNCGT